MGRLTDDMTQLVGAIHAARDERERLMRELNHATVETRRTVAHLRRSVVTDLAGARAAWLGAGAPISPRSGALETTVPRERRGGGGARGGAGGGEGTQAPGGRAPSRAGMAHVAPSGRKE